MNFNVSSGNNTLAQIRPMPIGMFGFNLGPSLPERVRLIFRGRLIAVRGFELSSANRAIKEEILDAVASGRDFVANPDLLQPVREKWSLAVYDRKTFHTFDANGDTD